MPRTKTIQAGLLFCMFWHFGFSQPELADSAKNVFQNTAGNTAWNDFAEKMNHFKSSKQGHVIIVHLGDSHIQGGYFTNSVRGLLQKGYGISGRGWVFPYALVNTNGAEDVSFKSTTSWNYLKYNKVKPFRKTSISGYSLESNDSMANLSIVLKQQSETLYPFDELAIFHQNARNEIIFPDNSGLKTEEVSENLSITKVKLNRTADSITFHIRTNQKPDQLYGIELMLQRPGIIYDVLGVNGVGFETYDKMIQTIPIVKVLHPDCIIISLGTNDAYVQKLNEAELKKHVLSVIRTVKLEAPNACIILTTPGDHLLRKKYLNPNIILTCNIIKSVAKQEQCVYWDFFEVMGGQGSAKKWSSNGLLYKDMLHLSKDGYKYQGELFYKAFQKTLELSNHDQ